MALQKTLLFCAWYSVQLQISIITNVNGSDIYQYVSDLQHMFTDKNNTYVKKIMRSKLIKRHLFSKTYVLQDALFQTVNKLL